MFPRILVLFNTVTLKKLDTTNNNMNLNKNIIYKIIYLKRDIMAQINVYNSQQTFTTKPLVQIFLRQHTKKIVKL